MKNFFKLSLLLPAFALLTVKLAADDGPSFAVISDTHFDYAPRSTHYNDEGSMVKVPRALKNLLWKKPLDALFVVGDLTDEGEAGQYDSLLSVFKNRDIVPENLPVYYLMGNHDNISGALARPNYLKLNQPLHQYIEIKGYPFITLSQTGTSNENYDDAALKFLSDTLAYAAKKFPGKPIFFFIHVPPGNTCYGSGDNEGGWGGGRCLSVLEKYPQVIVFSGHSHFPLGDPRSIHQDKYTAVNDGSTTYSEVEPGLVDEGIHPPEYVNVTEGLIVNILNSGNTVEMERWDTFRDYEMLPEWKVEAPYDGTNFAYKGRDGLPAPSFAENVKPRIDLQSGLCSIVFPQATDNETVRNYVIEILDGNTVAGRFSQFSQYYLNRDMPDSLRHTFYDLPFQKELLARVTAFDTYNNSSLPVLSDPFAIQIDPVDPDLTAPAADLLDVAFSENGGATDISPLHNTIYQGGIRPETYRNTTYNRWAARFPGSPRVYFAMKYGGRQEIKDAFMNGFSYETFYMANNVTNYNVIGAANNGGSCIEINSLGKFEFWIRHTETPEGNSSKYLIIGTNVSAVAGKYHHVVCTYDRDAHHAAIYIDGRKAGEADVPNRYAFPNNTDWLAVGGDASARPDPDHPGNLLSDLPLNGEIQIARMYGKALSWEEVFLLYLEAIDGERSGNAPPVSGKKVYISGGTLYIKGFSGSAAVNVYNLPGHKLAEYKAVENHVPVNLAGGIYVVTVSDKGILYKYKVTVK